MYFLYQELYKNYGIHCIACVIYKIVLALGNLHSLNNRFLYKRNQQFIMLASFIPIPSLCNAQWKQ